MRRVNKKIILLSLIIATVFLNNSDILANATSSAARRSGANRNLELMQEGRIAIENAFKNSDYDLFISTIKKLNINDNITKDQFAILVKSYNLFKDKKQNEAIKLLQDNKINPVLMKFINNGNMNLTDAQKEVLKKASELVKEGKVDEAKAIIQSAGLPGVPVKIDKKINKIQAKEAKEKREELKKAFDKARELKKEGKFDEAKKVLRDAGIPDNLQDKINVASTTEKKRNLGILQSIKNLFIR